MILRLCQEFAGPIAYCENWEQEFPYREVMYLLPRAMQNQMQRLLDDPALTWEEKVSKLNHIFQYEVTPFLQEIAPVGHYFGEGPKDPSILGYWPGVGDPE